MAKFAYMARDNIGVAISGEVVARTKDEAVRTLRGEGKFVVRLNEVDEQAQVAIVVTNKGGRRVKSDEIIYFANQLAGMLVFEDRDSEGSSKTKINGNANTLLNGTIYLPVSPMDFAGTAGVSSQCLMIAASQIKLTGNANMTTFCPPSQSSEINVVNTQGTVKLVA